MPIAIGTILFQFINSVMPPDVLQVGHGSLDFSALRHGVDMIIEHSHFSPCEETRNPFSPAFHFRPPPKRYCVPPACERAGGKVGVPTPIKFRIEWF